METFDDIRPYRDHELSVAISSLLAESEFVNLVQFFFKEKTASVLQHLKNISSADEFQVFLIKPVMNNLIENTSKGLSWSGVENIPRDKPCLFISNHRDIVLDPALLDMVLHLNGIPTVEIAIGSNLLIKPWIETLVRVNKSFVVRRDVSGRELLRSSTHLSNYIRTNISERNCYTWIAQREGRAKDGNDLTHEGLLRMLGMSGHSRNLAESLLPLNIVPISISYEYDPCAGLKALEMWSKENNNWKKTPEGDLKSMVLGMQGFKGHIHFHFNPMISNDIAGLASLPHHEQPKAIAELIDHHIHKSYRLFASHQFAYDMQNQVQELQQATEVSNEIMDQIYVQLKSAGLDASHLSYVLRQYANPVNNFHKAIRNS